LTENLFFLSLNVLKIVIIMDIVMQDFVLAIQDLQEQHVVTQQFAPIIVISKECVITEFVIVIQDLWVMIVGLVFAQINALEMVFVDLMENVHVVSTGQEKIVQFLDVHLLVMDKGSVLVEFVNVTQHMKDLIVK